MQFEASAYDDFRDVPTWNLFFAFHASYNEKVETNELACCAANPKTSVIRELTFEQIEGRTVRDWMQVLSPVGCIRLLTSKILLPFPSPETLEMRALARVAHTTVRMES